MKDREHIQLVNEEWKPVKGYEGLYEVSNHGRVRSLDRAVKTNSPFHTKTDVRRLKGKILRLGNMTSGYLFACLCRDKKTKNFSVHRLVAQAFIPNPDNLPCVNHIDHDKKNNHLKNLEWVTYSENNYDSAQKGTDHNSAKLTEKEVLEIRESPLHYLHLAMAFNVSVATISDIKKRRTWRHLK